MPTYAPVQFSQTSSRIEIPKNTYVPVFQLNPVKQEKSETHSPSSVILASIAVIPFNQNPEQSHGTFADDITAAIVTGLTQFRELSIVGPLMKYKDQSVDAKNIGQLYRVQFMLEGRVQILGDTLRVRTNLTDCRTGFKMWSQIYEYTHTTHNLFEIEDHMTRRIVCDLADHTGIIPNIISKESMQKHLESLKIHEAIYRYEYFLRVLTTDAYYSAVGALEHVTKINPNNALALAMLSHAYAVNYLFDMKVSSASLEDAERLALQALKNDPDCQMAHFAEGFLRFFQGRADQCVAKLRLAILLNPFNAYVISVSGMQLCMLGLWEEGMDLWEKSIQLNPYLQTIYAFVPFMYHYHKGEFEAAWKNAILPNWPIFWVPVMRATAAAQLGLQEQAQDALKELLEMRPDFPSHARELMRRLVYLEDNVEMLLEGLLKAGHYCPVNSRIS